MTIKIKLKNNDYNDKNLVFIENYNLSNLFGGKGGFLGVFLVYFILGFITFYCYFLNYALFTLMLYPICLLLLLKYGSLISIWSYLISGWRFEEPISLDVKEFIKKYGFEKYLVKNIKRNFVVLFNKKKTIYKKQSIKKYDFNTISYAGRFDLGVYWLKCFIAILLFPIIYYAKTNIYLACVLFFILIVYLCVLYVYGNIISIWSYLFSGWTFAEPDLPEVKEFIKKWGLEKYVR
jgi:hypothetical protein